MSPTGHATWASINWWAWDGEKLPMGWFLIDFIVFAALILTFTWEPLKAALRERHLTIKRAVSQAAEAHAKASAANKALRGRLDSLDQEIRTLEENSRRDGEAERAQMEAQANAYADRLATESESLVGESMKRAEQRLRRRLLSRALQQAEATVQTRMASEDHQRLLDDAIDKLAWAEPDAPRKAAAR